MADHKKTLKLKPLFRGVEFKREDIDEENRTVKLSFSSEDPYERWFGMEVLGHAPGEVDLKRLNNKAALLDGHDTAKQIGVVERAWIEAGKGYAEVRFSKSAAAEEVFRDVLDGIRTKVSVGYRVDAATMVSKVEGLATYRMKWTPFEISSVSIPADDTVGVGRNAEFEATEVTITDKTMKKNILLNPDASGGGGAAVADKPVIQVNEDAVRAEAGKAERKRTSEILTLCQLFKGKPAEAQKFIEDGKTVSEYQRHLLDTHGADSPITVSQNPNVGMSGKEARRFSIMEAARQVAKKGFVYEGIEKEASDAAAKQYGRSLRDGSFIVPNDVLSVRTQSAGTFGDGGATVQTQYGPMIEILNNAMVTVQAGITVISGVVGDLVYPQQTGGATAYWVTETGALTDSSATFAQKTMTPHRCGATVPYTTQFLAQTSLSAEAFLRSELMTRLALLKDLSILHGTGVSGQPLGVQNTTGINATVTYGGAATWADVVEHETGIAADNAELGSMAFILSAATVGKWKTILKDSVAGAGYLIGEGMTANGYPVLRTNQVSGNVSFFGVWNQVIHASWAGMEFIVDPYTLKKSGQVEITVNELCDNLVRQPLAFNVSTDSAAQ